MVTLPKRAFYSTFERYLIFYLLWMSASQCHLLSRVLEQTLLTPKNTLAALFLCIRGSTNSCTEMTDAIIVLSCC